MGGWKSRSRDEIQPHAAIVRFFRRVSCASCGPPTNDVSRKERERGGYLLKGVIIRTFYAAVACAGSVLSRANEVMGNVDGVGQPMWIHCRF